MVYVHNIKRELRRLLEDVTSPDYPETAAVRDYLADQLRRAIASAERNAELVERRDRW